ncbi:MAG TPA: peptide chain release factor 2, partial [Chlamydiales bacterium]|nr:peptide chain release factor 2 [Chlamydiales bacterium]
KVLDILDLPKIEKQIQEIGIESSSASFWQDPQNASEKMTLLSTLQKRVDSAKAVGEMIEVGRLNDAQELLSSLELVLFMAEEFDSSSAIVSVHSGQGGVEAMDWASMLYRMYMKYCEKKGFKTEVIDQSQGEEAGIKSITFSVDGEYAYGTLRHEAGVHRLVRLSPFNSNNLRQTSFALVEVIPQIEKSEAVEIKDEDLEWDFYRASSHGGQNVQKVSSAVRLKHKPTGIVVTAQAERYQNQNRENALELLIGKLWLISEEERKKKEKTLKGYKTPGWGNQIRSYVLHPYKMVKDLRTDYETSNVDSVLDGDLETFVQEEIRKNV